MDVHVDISHLTKKFGQFTVVDDLSFSVQKGEVLGFLGPNGAGKSTTMKIISGFLAPTEGEVKVCGLDLKSDLIQLKQHIGYVPEGAPLYGDMKTGQFLNFIADIRGMVGSHKRRRMAAVIEQVALEGVLDQTIDTLSKGFKRRVGLAQALLHDPDVLILDEPTDGLDPNQKHHVRDLIRGMSKNKIIIISTHILEEVHAVCSRAMIIDKGRLIADGTPAELEAKADNHLQVILELGRVCTSDCIDKIRSLPGVSAVDMLPTQSDVCSLIISPNQKQSILGEVNQLAQQQGWQIQQISQQNGHLDDAFRNLTINGAS